MTEKTHSTMAWVGSVISAIVALVVCLAIEQRIPLGYMIFAGTMTLLYGIPATIVSGIFRGALRHLTLDIAAYIPIIPSAVSHVLLTCGFVIAGRQNFSWLSALICVSSFASGVLQILEPPPYLHISARTIALNDELGGLAAIGIQLFLGLYTIVVAVKAWPGTGTQAS